MSAADHTTLPGGERAMATRKRRMRAPRGDEHEGWYGRLYDALYARDWPHRWMVLLGSPWCGNWQMPTPPTLRWGDRDGLAWVSAALNDSFEWGVGWPSEWHFTGIRAKDARRVAVWILWTWWVKAEWFGLRRWLWYRALHAAVRPMPSGERRGQS